MTGARWKLVVDGENVTIAGDRFQLTTNGTRTAQNDLAMDDSIFDIAESSQMEAIVSELQTMTRRPYGQFCGLSRALEIIGERWALLIIRNLLVGPKSVTDLHWGLPRMPANILCTRLNELEHTGVIRRSGMAQPDGSAVYELTEWGKELDDIALRLGRWGARLLGEPRPEDIVTVDSLIMAMRTAFRPEAASGLRVGYELRTGEFVISARVDDGTVEVSEGPLPGADLVIEPGRALKSLMSGELSPADALENGSVQVTGDASLLGRFVEVFHIPGLATRPMI